MMSFFKYTIMKTNTITVLDAKTMKVLYTAPDATPAAIAAVNGHLDKIASLTLAGTDAKISDFVAPGQRISAFPSEDGKAILLQPAKRVVSGAEVR